ncbi:hypothetical protein [Anaerococcus hydrogenalis]|uniref:Uncharacterized protein n=1 Tax=Anaerococcus hydrogenalis ACS-025-V-Sch4 TaxID=879306 RepID=F0H2F0_9FIRM|nr:hypothetical protein [Anaerococcus hydrogenalis]EGC83384.1 hypothetical protein HMPREF9246_0311 [Anaerococcus hydrogenalis ACS-025-V-Sch4]
MKTKEFIKRVKELGFEVFNEDDYLVIKDEYESNVANVNKTTLAQMSTDYIEWDEIYDEDKTKLFDLLIEYAKTPIDERKEEKKFYLKHRWIKGCVIMYLYRNTLNGYCYLGDKKCRPHRQKMFTLKEIEEIKEKYNTDLSDFEKKEVEE